MCGIGVNKYDIKTNIAIRKVIYMNNFKVVLDIKESLTKAWPENNFLNSILQTRPTGYDWLMNTHIQTYGSFYENKTFNISEIRVTFYPYGMLRTNIYDLCPFIRKYAIYKDIILCKYNGLSDFVKYSIDKGFYVSARINQFFRKDIEDYFIHPLYIYGYDAYKKIVYACDNFEGGKYASKEISFDDLDKSFTFEEKSYWEASVFLYEMFDYKFEDNKGFICAQVEDYLNSGSNMCYLNRFTVPSSTYENETEKGEIYFGIKCYDLLKRQIKQGREFSNYNIDLRSFAFLVDHKQMMFLRLTYLHSKKIISVNQCEIKKYNDLLEKSKILLMLILKYNTSKKREILLKADSLLDEIKEYDIYCMEKLLTNIKL